MAAHLSTGVVPARTETHDSFGFATGALMFDLSLPPGQASTSALRCVPVAGAPSISGPLFDWGGKLPAAQWAGSGWISEVVHAALTATAHILITRRGPALQPGPRRYTRSWIRDGAMMSA